MKHLKKPKTVLCISGYDPLNIAGNSADSRTCYQLNTYPVTALTAITSQNNRQVSNIMNVDKKSFISQLDSILAEVEVHAVKIGMLFSVDFFSIVQQYISQYSLSNIIYDPVLYSSSGSALMQEPKEKFIKKILAFSQTVDWITPNIPEVEEILSIKITKEIEIENSLHLLYKKGFKNIIIKGGHIRDTHHSIDYYFNGNTIYKKNYKKIKNNKTRATGCTFSTALACFLTKGYPHRKAFFAAKKFTYNCIQKKNPISYLDNNQKTYCWQI